MIPWYYPSQFALFFLQFTTISVIYARVVNDETPLPRFLPTLANLTVNAGEVAEIKCQIQNLGGRTVVWRRASEPNPLSIGTAPYTEKHRVRVAHTGQVWTLYLGNVQPVDSGVYECQISSKENLKKLFMLRVNGTGTGTRAFPKDVPGHPVTLKPTIKVHGTEVVEVGQPIRLECNTSRVLDSPQDLDWFRNGDKITPNFNKKITLKTEELKRAGVYRSRLVIEHSEKSHTGMYLCRNSNREVARIYVDVLNTYSSNVKRGGSMTEGSEGGTGAAQHLQPGLLCHLWALIAHTLSIILLLRTVS